MTWPQSQDYNEAIQNLDQNCGEAELRQGRATRDGNDIPVVRSGGFADVYEVRCPTGKNYAVKCFTREVAGLRERYQEISDHLRRVKLPFTVEFTYVDKGLLIRGQWYPILKMQWVEGLALNTFVQGQLDKPQVLNGLLPIWFKLARRLRDAQMAHADLQHGNVLLVPGGKTSALAVKLIDYDGMYVPALAAQKSGELGHPSFQHPQRLREGIYSGEVDRFPHLVICCAFRALAVQGRKLWDGYTNEDNLLFRKEDFQAPGRSPLLHDLWKLTDPAAHSLAGRVILACQRPLDQVPLLDEVFVNGKSVPLTADQEREVKALLAVGSGKLRAVPQFVAPPASVPPADAPATEPGGIPRLITPPGTTGLPPARPGASPPQASSAGPTGARASTAPTKAVATVVGLLFLSLLSVFWLWPALQKMRASTGKSASAERLRKLAWAMLGYADASKAFPPPAITGEDGRPLLSWRVALLPYLGEDDLFSRFKLDEPWDSPHNKQLLGRMPNVFAPPSGSAKEPFQTYYQVFVSEGKKSEQFFASEGTVFEVGDPGKGVTPVMVIDGLSHTFLIVEAGEPVPWTKPEDLVYDGQGPLPQLGGLFPDGFHAAMADANVHFIPKSVDERLLRLAITRNDNKTFTFHDLLPR